MTTSSLRSLFMSRATSETCIHSPKAKNLTHREFDLKKNLSSPDSSHIKWAVMVARFAVVSLNCSLFTSGSAKRLEPREKSRNMTAVVWSPEGSERYATRMISPNESEQLTRDTYISVFNTSFPKRIINILNPDSSDSDVSQVSGGRISAAGTAKTLTASCERVETMFSHHLRSAEEKEAVWHIICVKTCNSVLFYTWMSLSSEMWDW